MTPFQRLIIIFEHIKYINLFFLLFILKCLLALLNGLFLNDPCASLKNLQIFILIKMKTRICSYCDSEGNLEMFNLVLEESVSRH